MRSMTKHQVHHRSDEELVELGKKLEEFYESGYISKKQALTFSLLKGIAGGAGAFIGGTLVIALLLWVLSLFDALPFIGHIAETVRDALHRAPR